MIAVADTSPLCYLPLIGEGDLLAKLFAEVAVPEAVITELGHPRVPAAVQAWLDSPETRLVVHSVTGVVVSPELRSLDAGEREAILLAQQLAASVVILDDKAARVAAKRCGLRVVGTLGLLEVASREGWVDLQAAVGRLRRTNFRASPTLLDDLLRRNV